MTLRFFDFTAFSFVFVFGTDILSSVGRCELFCLLHSILCLIWPLSLAFIQLFQLSLSLSLPPPPFFFALLSPGRSFLPVFPAAAYRIDPSRAPGQKLKGDCAKAATSVDRIGLFCPHSTWPLGISPP